MICPDKVRDICLFGMMCPREPVVDDDGECAAYIRSALALMDAKADAQPDQADPVEAAERQREREAIQGECEVLKSCPFCGSRPVLQSDIRYPRPECEPRTAYEVVCKNWNCVIGYVDERYKLTAREAIDAWNRRAENVADV